jgi:bacteriocin-like protein
MLQIKSDRFRLAPLPFPVGDCKISRRWGNSPGEEIPMIDERNEIAKKDELTEKELAQTSGGVPPDPCIPVDPCKPEGASRKR